ncbi:restriction endonuclease subunit S [candidate division CSSED10-310 bacterium]|uniref:Restriction endonuclease subunit S n=1 Tax=candidate division CSSED10-310 bacterium TaxID=2855610 RepID=A0ABV6Z4U5_UNCC1
MMKPYPEYKDCSVELLSEIPSNWKTMKLYYFLEKITNGYVGPTRDIMRGSGIPYIQGIHIKGNTVKFTPDGFYYVDEEWSNKHFRSILRENDVLVVQTGSIGEVGIVPSDLDGANCHALIILRAISGVGYGRYLMWLLSSDFGHHSFYSIKTGDILFHLNSTKVKDLGIPIPSLLEQAQIAAYLDHKTHLIDSLIEKKQKQIELLKEYRTALINQAVTKGLNPEVPKKDSGIPAFGNVPTHWPITRNKNLFREVNERSITGKEELLTVSHITGVTPRSEKDVTMFMASTLVGYKLCQPGDLIINTMWAWMGALGTSNNCGVVSPSYNVYRFKQSSIPKFFDYLVRSPSFVCEIKRFSKGVWSSRLRLYPEYFFEIKVPFPPFSEQEEIVEFLNIKIKKIDNYISQNLKIIDFIKEHRTTLISNVVTGKIDVRDEVLP